jgi:hypothetical protein
MDPGIPIAACGLAIIMVGAAITHLRRKEPQPIVVNAVSSSRFWWRSLRFGPYSS